MIVRSQYTICLFLFKEVFDKKKDDSIAAPFDRILFLHEQKTWLYKSIFFCYYIVEDLFWDLFVAHTVPDGL